VLFADEVDDFKSGFLNSVNNTITHHINFDRLPLGAEGMLRNSHSNLASANTYLLIFHCIILWGLGIKEQA
jgi:hypothetical protein